MRYDQIIIELQKQIDENERKIAENTKNKDALISCQSGIKNTLSLFYSLIPYFTLFGTMSFLYGNGNISIPTELSACIITGGTIAASTVFNAILTSKSRKKIIKASEKSGKLKSSLKEIRNAKKNSKAIAESTIIEETIGLVIEIEKLSNRNKVLKTTIDKLKEQQKQETGIEAPAGQLNIQIKETVSEDSEKHTAKIQELKEELNECYQELDSMTMKKELDRYSESKSALKKALMVSGILTFYASSPILLKYAAGINTSITPIQTLMTILGAFTIGTAACTLYMKKQNLYFKNAVENIDSKTQYKQENNEEPTDNKTLTNQESKEKSTNNKSLTKQERKERKKREAELIQNLIKKISQIEFEMQEQKSMFEVVEENKKPKYEYKFDEYQPELYCEQQPCEIVEEKGDQYTLRIPQKRL